MPSGSAGRRYAQAIFDLAREQNKLEQWAADLENLSSVFNQPEVLSYLQNPKTSRDKKKALVQNVLDNRVSPEAIKLTMLLVQRDRFRDIVSINEEFTRLWNRLKGIIVAEVTTAVAVGPNEENEIRQRLAAITGKQVTVEMKVDPEIIGGLVARVGDTLIDGSVRTRLQNLRKQLA